MSLHLIYYESSSESMQNTYYLFDDASDELIDIKESDIMDICRQKGTVYNVDWSNPHYISTKGSIGHKNSTKFMAVGNSDRYLKLYNPTEGVYFLDKRYINTMHIRNRIENLITNSEIEEYKDRYLRDLPYKKEYNVIVKKEYKSLNSKLDLLGITSYEFDYNCNIVVIDREKCTEVTLPSFTKRVMSKQFSECNRLNNVLLNRELEEIGNDAFDRCRRLQTIRLPDKVKSIGRGAFRQCSNLRGIRLPDGVTEIKRRCFSMCNKLTGVQLPKNLREIDSEAFYGCISLEHIEIPKYVDSIDITSFYGCDNIRFVRAPIHLEEQVYNAIAKGRENVVKIELY